MLWEWELDGTATGSCQMARFGISAVEPSASATAEFVRVFRLASSGSGQALLASDSENGVESPASERQIIP
jgi:hypothetical protein